MNESPPEKRRAGLKFALLILFLAALVLLAKFTGAGEYLRRGKIAFFLEGMGIWAPIAYTVAYVVLTVFAFPGLPLTIAGALPATLYIVLGATVGASGCFFIARYLGRDFVARFLRGGQLRGSTRASKRTDSGSSSSCVSSPSFLSTASTPERGFPG